MKRYKRPSRDLGNFVEEMRREGRRIRELGVVPFRPESSRSNLYGLDDSRGFSSGYQQK